jgi:hypothetical protein
MELTLNLTLDQTNAILAALGKLPAEQVLDLILNIRKQAQDQVQRQQSAETTENNNGSD